MSITKTPIEWCTHTVNPIRAVNKETGRIGHFCEKCSPGCKNCYSSRLQPRFGTFPFIAENRDKVDLVLDEEKLQSVIRMRKPAEIFWCDMTDMFLADHPDEWVDKCFAAMALSPQHRHLVLTKRDFRLVNYIGADKFTLRWDEIRKQAAFMWRGLMPEFDWPLRNVWLGVSVEDRERKGRIERLRATPAAVRFLSIEPLLEDLGEIDLTGIGWVIVGGESGPGARPFDLYWAQSIIDQCQRAGVACFVKQIGAAPLIGGLTVDGPPGKGGDMNYWPAWLKVRECPNAS